MFKGMSITKRTFSRKAGGNIVSEDIAELGADGHFVRVEFRGLRGGWGSCRS
jgi:hypothetical protein